MILQADINDVLNGIPHGVALVDGDFRIEQLNWFLEASTGYKSEDVRGVHCDFVVRSNLGQKCNASFMQVLDTGVPLSLHGDIIDANRRVVPVKFTISRFSRGRDGFGLLMVIEDMSLQSELERKSQGFEGGARIIGHSQRMLELFELLPVLSHTDASILITGETGTGKDLLAESVHMASKRASAPFIKVNCGALPETLLESELFGHVRGAFTGAHSDKPGMFRLAQGGTLYLTEIADLPLHLQVKLLTVLDDMEFYPVGSSRKVKVDVRLIAGTHRDLRHMVGAGQFREDLYFRLNVLRAHMPPLRQRSEDIPILIDHFLRVFTANLGKSIKGLSADAMTSLIEYSYPGNVRELRNIIEYAVNICQADTVSQSHLPAYMTHPTHAHKSGDTPPGTGDKEQSVASADYRAFNGTTASSWSMVEKNRILDALIKSRGNRSNAAVALGLSRSTLWRKIKQYGLE